VGSPDLRRLNLGSIHVTSILIAEDDPLQAELIRRYAVSEGYDDVRVVGDGREALEQFRRAQPDLLVLDLMLPRVDGLDVCRIVRSESDLPIIMVTARSSEDDLLLGLDLGADDYLVKPYSPRELMGRIRALLRRARLIDDTERPLVAGDLVVDIAAHEVRFAGTRVDCTPGEFACLELLASAPGRTFSRDQLLRRVHGVDRFVSRRTIDVHVANLRKKIGAAGLIRTVYGVGYALESI